MFSIHGVGEENWLRWESLTFNKDLNLFCVFVSPFSLVATTTYADQVDI